MYYKAYGIIKTLAPLHVGAAAGEEAGNLNLIFRDQFTQTGIIPGSSIRGRFRAEMRRSQPGSEQDIYGNDADSENGTTESLVKFEYASLVWLPVFCPGQPVVWVSCPRLLKRYAIAKGLKDDKGEYLTPPDPYTAPKQLKGKAKQNGNHVLFFNLGWLEVTIPEKFDWTPWIAETGLQQNQIVVVDNADIGLIHDMALYRQSRVTLETEQKKVDEGKFFGAEALPEGSVMIFPVAIKESEEQWQPLPANDSTVYLGGLESIGFGRCEVKFGGEYFQQEAV
ncbi:MAG: RAMP superfamily CRISPR-associated protein [Spirulinaceae cyanobacterium]